MADSMENRKAYLQHVLKKLAAGHLPWALPGHRLPLRLSCHAVSGKRYHLLTQLELPGNGMYFTPTSLKKVAMHEGAFLRFPADPDSVWVWSAPSGSFGAGSITEDLLGEEPGGAQPEWLQLCRHEQAESLLPFCDYPCCDRSTLLSKAALWLEAHGIPLSIGKRGDPRYDAEKGIALTGEPEQSPMAFFRGVFRAAGSPELMHRSGWRASCTLKHPSYDLEGLACEIAAAVMLAFFSEAAYPQKENSEASRWYHVLKSDPEMYLGAAALADRMISFCFPDILPEDLYEAYGRRLTCGHALRPLMKTVSHNEVGTFCLACDRKIFPARVMRKHGIFSFKGFWDDLSFSLEAFELCPRNDTSKMIGSLQYLNAAGDGRPVWRAEYGRPYSDGGEVFVESRTASLWWWMKHRDVLRYMCSTLRDNGFEADEDPWRGLSKRRLLIRLDRRGWLESCTPGLTVGKLAALYYTLGREASGKEGWSTLELFARRLENDICQLHRTYVGGGSVDADFERYFCSSFEKDAVDNMNPDYIEIRSFRSTLDVTQLLASLQFVSNSAHFAAAHSLTECLDAGIRSVLAWEHYSELDQYAASLGLL